jgi:hypothetical protein
MIYDGIHMSDHLVDSVLMLGQSNMAGRGDMGQVKPIRNPLCYMLRMGRWQPMCEPVNPDRGIFEGRFRSGISLAASFADEYARNYQSPVGLIPCADGGTSLDEWMPGQLLYDHAVMQTRLAVRTSKLKAILWHQGESDCLCDETVAAYREKFLRMIAQLRKDLGAENVPVILGELPQQMGANWKTGGREQQLNVILRQLAREVPCCAIASSAGLSMKADGAHFDSPACREFGKRYFEAYQQLR